MKPKPKYPKRGDTSKNVIVEYRRPRAALPALQELPKLPGLATVGEALTNKAANGGR